MRHKSVTLITTTGFLIKDVFTFIDNHDFNILKGNLLNTDFGFLLNSGVDVFGSLSFTPGQDYKCDGGRYEKIQFHDITPFWVIILLPGWLKHLDIHLLSRLPSGYSSGRFKQQDEPRTDQVTICI